MKIDDAAAYLLRALLVKQGVTSADGNLLFTSLVDITLAGAVGVPGNMTVVIWPGVPLLCEVRESINFNPVTGEITATQAFAAQVLAGTPYVLLAVPPRSAQELALIWGALQRQWPFIDYWSLQVPLITVPAAGADLAFPDVVVGGLPAAAVVTRVIATLKIAAIEDTSGAQNEISAAARTLRIKANAGAWPGTICITFAQNAWKTQANGFRGGDAVPGNVDMSAVVVGNDTYNFATRQTGSADALVATGASLLLLDVQVGLRVYFL